jgi:hypothetical protein
MYRLSAICYDFINLTSTTLKSYKAVDRATSLKLFTPFFSVDYCLRRVVPLYKMLLEGVDVEIVGTRNWGEMCRHL